jgi:hypothetical protein
VLEHLADLEVLEVDALDLQVDAGGDDAMRREARRVAQ